MREGATYQDGWTDAMTLYTGTQGTLPAIGEKVRVKNFWDSTERVGRVTERDAERHEYTVTFGPIQATLL